MGGYEAITEQPGGNSSIRKRVRKLQTKKTDQIIKIEEKKP